MCFYYKLDFAYRLGGIGIHEESGIFMDLWVFFRDMMEILWEFSGNVSWDQNLQWVIMGYNELVMRF